MFDLDREVRAWSAAVHAERCRSEAEVAELSDHLHCEIDRARAEGLSDEAAFRVAVSRLGSTPELIAEHAKNRSALGVACRVAAKLDRPAVSSEERRLLIAHAMIWAALIVSSSLVLPKSAAVWFLISVGPLWWASQQVLRAALRHRTSH